MPSIPTISSMWRNDSADSNMTVMWTWSLTSSRAAWLKRAVKSLPGLSRPCRAARVAGSATPGRPHGRCRDCRPGGRAGPDAAVEQAGDPLAVAFGGRTMTGKPRAPAEDGHVGDGLHRRGRVLHVDAGEIEAGGLEQGQGGGVAREVDPGPKLTRPSFRAAFIGLACIVAPPQSARDCPSRRLGPSRCLPWGPSPLRRRGGAHAWVAGEPAARPYSVTTCLNR